MRCALAVKRALAPDAVMPRCGSGRRTAGADRTLRTASEARRISARNGAGPARLQRRAVGPGQPRRGDRGDATIPAVPPGALNRPGRPAAASARASCARNDSTRSILAFSRSRTTAFCSARERGVERRATRRGPACAAPDPAACASSAAAATAARSGSGFASSARIASLTFWPHARGPARARPCCWRRAWSNCTCCDVLRLSCALRLGDDVLDRRAAEARMRAAGAARAGPRPADRRAARARRRRAERECRRHGEAARRAEKLTGVIVAWSSSVDASGSASRNAAVRVHGSRSNSRPPADSDRILPRRSRVRDAAHCNRTLPNPRLALQSVTPAAAHARARDVQCDHEHQEHRRRRSSSSTTTCACATCCRAT